MSAATESPASTPQRPKSRHRLRNAIIVGVVAVVVVFVVLFAIPFSHPFSFRASSYYSGAIVAPGGSQVSGSFATNNSDKVDFLILGTGMNPIYQADGANGSFSFISPSGGFGIKIYLFGESCTVDVSGQFSAPVVWSPSFPIIP